MNGFGRKESLKKWLYYFCAGLTHFSGVERLRNLGAASGSVRILMYHKVNDQKGNSLSVPVSLFDEQMGELAERYQVISAEDLLAHVLTATPLPPRAVLLTFDDGYRDVLTHAYPILKRYGHPAILFVSTDFIGSQIPFPHDRRFTHFLNPPLDWDEVTALTECFEVGSHACSHRSLARLGSEEARREIFDSKAIIEERIGRPVRCFSYPKGGIRDFNPRLRDDVRRAGYQLCFTTIRRTNRSPLDPFALGRYNVEPYSGYYFRRLLEGSCDLMRLGGTRWGDRLKQSVVGCLGADTD